MIVEDNTRMRRKPIKDISVGECFKLDDTPGTLYLRINIASISRLNSELIPCVKMLKGTVDIIEDDRLVYPVKSKLIVSEENNIDKSAR